MLAFLNRFLELEPEHARAYLERAGTYHHKGEVAKSQADLKRSCDLGNPEACTCKRNEQRIARLKLFDMPMPF